MIAFFIIPWIGIGMICYIGWGHSEGWMTPIYWTTIWPIMGALTIWEHREYFELWFSNWYDTEYRMELWYKISEFFKVRIK